MLKNVAFGTAQVSVDTAVRVFTHTMEYLIRHEVKTPTMQLHL